MKKWIAGSLLLFAVHAGFAAEDPVVATGPVPAVPSSVYPGYKNTFVITLKNNVNAALPLSITGAVSPLTRVTVANDCGNTLAPGPSTCNIGIAAAPSLNDVGIVGQNIEMNYQGRAPIVENFAFTVEGILSVTNGSPAALFFTDTGTITITNISPDITARNIAANFAGTALAGKVAQTATTCQSLAPGQSCTLTFTTNATAVGLTNFIIAGTNTENEPASMSITPIAVGTTMNGGVVGCTTASGGTGNLIAATLDNSPAGGLTWSPNLVFTGATSTTNGQANTSTIVAAFGSSTAYAAGLCDSYSIDSNGFSPCQTGTCYDAWYLPASAELSCVNANNAAIVGFTAMTYYWSSTDSSANTAFGEFFNVPPAPPYTPILITKVSQIHVRCVSKAGTGN